mgnify:CR=1 FL=1
MAEKITLRDTAVDGDLKAADINGERLWSSADQVNTYSSNLYKAGEVTFKYNNFVGDSNVELVGVIEGKSPITGDWYTAGYQFDSFRDGSATERTVIVDPNVFWPDAGISNIVYMLGSTRAEISPQQVTLPEDWRACVLIRVPAGSTFTSVDLDVHAELVNKES